MCTTRCSKWKRRKMCWYSSQLQRKWGNGRWEALISGCWGVCINQAHFTFPTNHTIVLGHHKRKKRSAQVMCWKWAARTPKVGLGAKTNFSVLLDYVLPLRRKEWDFKIVKQRSYGFCYHNDINRICYKLQLTKYFLLFSKLFFDWSCFVYSLPWSRE